MERFKSNLDFRLMSLTFKVRDLFRPRANVLREVGIRPGFRVLDYGCGPGSYILPLAELVGDSGEIYALDTHPLAVGRVGSIASKRGLGNLKVIRSDCKTGLPDNSVDVVLLYDTFHELSEPNDVLQELNRTLKPGGVLSFSDHHMERADILSKMTAGNLFKFSAEGRQTYSFQKLG